MCQETADFAEGERDEAAARSFWGDRGGDGEVGVGEHREGDVAVPRVEATDLVVVEPDLGLRGLEAFLDRPPGAGDPDEVVAGGAGRAGAQLEPVWEAGQRSHSARVAMRTVAR